MEEQVLKFLSTGPKKSNEIICQFGANKELYRALSELIWSNKIKITEINTYSTWEKN